MQHICIHTNIMKYISEQNCIREFFIRRSREFVYIANSGNILTRKDVFQQCKPATDSPAPTTSYYLTSSLHTNGSCVSQAMSCYMQNIMWYLVSNHTLGTQPTMLLTSYAMPTLSLFIPLYEPHSFSPNCDRCFLRV